MAIISNMSVVFILHVHITCMYVWALNLPIHTLTTVTVHLKLPNFRLHYFVHSPVSMNPSQGVYGGIGGGLVNC